MVWRTMLAKTVLPGTVHHRRIGSQNNGWQLGNAGKLGKIHTLSRFGGKRLMLGCAFGRIACVRMQRTNHVVCILIGHLISTMQIAHGLGWYA